MNSLEWENKGEIGDAPPLNSYGVIVYSESFLYFTGGNPDIIFEPIKTFRYSLEDGKWENVTHPDEKESLRFFASGIVFEGYFYLFFGFNYTTLLNFNTIIRLKITSQVSLWENFQTYPSISKDSFSLVSISEHVYIFGGFLAYEQILQNNLIILNLKTKSLTTLNDNSISPEGRFSGTMSAINSKLYLFGGSNSIKLFNDMWIFDTTFSTWKAVTMSGTVPSARYLHAVSSEGDAIVLWGGIDSGGLKNDLYIFNALTNYWKDIIPESSVMPRAAKGACIVSRIPKIYIYGGITTSGFSGELWEFDMGTLSYKLISKNIELAYHSCEITEDILYVIFGSQSSDRTPGLVNAYNLISNTWKIIISTNESNLFVEDLHVLLKDTAISIGGRYWQTDASNSLLVIKDKLIPIIIPMSNYIYASSYVYYKSSIYAFGGGSVLGTSVLSSISSSLFITIDINEVCQSGICQTLCSGGTYKSGDSCKECSPGYYSEGKGNLECQPCSPGTYNQHFGASSSRQCYPCPENTFASEPGSSFCYDCPFGQSCPAGSKSSYIGELIQSENSIQPSIYSTPDSDFISLTYQTLCGIVFLLVFILFVAVDKLKNCLIIIDLYKDKHNYKLLQPVMLRKTLIGGFFTLAFFCFATILVGSTLIQYQLDNIQETKGLVPLLVLKAKVPKFSSPTFTIYTTFFGYGDTCGYDSICSSSISIDLTNMKGSSITYTCELSKLKSCIIIIKCLDCTINAGAQVLISASENLSYASGIQVNITTDSSIPESKSSLAYYLYPTPNYVFIGSKPSEFFFTITPSLFTSESSKWPNELLGYHVSSEITPSSGSQFMNIDLPIVSQAKVQIFLEINSSGLLTQRLLKQTWIFLVSGILGSIFGIQGAVGAAMRIFEQRAEKAKDENDVKKKYADVRARRKILIKGIFSETSQDNATDTKTLCLENKVLIGINTDDMV